MPNGVPRSAVALAPMATRDIDSTPPATTKSHWPEITAAAAKWTACWLDPHWRSSVVPGTDSGQPAASTALRPTFHDCSPTCETQPHTTSSTSRRVEPGAFGEAAEDEAGQIHRVHAGKTALATADRTAYRSDNDRVTHGYSSVGSDNRCYRDWYGLRLAHTFTDVTTPDPYDPTRPDFGTDWTQPQQPQDQPGYLPPTIPQPGTRPERHRRPATRRRWVGTRRSPVIAGVPSYGVDAYGRPLSDKSKVVAGVLGIVLGGFGVGRFYIGDTRTGVLQLIVTIFTCGLGHFWGLIDGIMILVNGGVDAQGRVLRD